MFYRNIVFPALCAWSADDAEKAHELSIKALRVAGKEPVRSILRSLLFVHGNAVRVWGLTFPSPLGLAAGFDKHAEAIDGLEALGFGFVEVGTVVPKPQPGRERPRLFRLREDNALINRMGFNSHGAEAVCARLLRGPDDRKRSIPIGVNVGKNADTPIEEAWRDYAKGIDCFYELAEYFVANISSPNTANLRTLQHREALDELVREIIAVRARKIEDGLGWKPLLLKVDPDMPNNLLEDSMDILMRLDGIVATNTTIEFPSTLRSRHKGQQGGLSGDPVHGKAVRRIKFLRRLAPSFPIVGVGGVKCGDTYQELRDAGATLVQMYTGFVYGGPLAPWRINTSIARRRFVEQAAT